MRRGHCERQKRGLPANWEVRKYFPMSDFCAVGVEGEGQNTADTENSSCKGHCHILKCRGWRAWSREGAGCAIGTGRVCRNLHFIVSIGGLYAKSSGESGHWHDWLMLQRTRC